MRYLVSLLLFLVHPLGALADFTGPVVSVLDGDTIEVLHNTRAERVRLSGIDCQEKGQAGCLSGDTSQAHLRADDHVADARAPSCGVL